MMEEYALEPCPFCGGQVELTEARYNAEADMFTCAVQCLKAGCYATTVFAFGGADRIRKAFPDEDENVIGESAKLFAARQWNRRAE